MVTATGAKPAKTINRSYLIQVQVRNLLVRTKATSQETLTKIDTAIACQWIHTIGVYGLDSSNHCHVGLELHIDWLTHTIRVLLAGDDVTIDRTVYVEDVAPEVINGISVFNQAVNAECLRAVCRVSYSPGVDLEHIRRVLGFVTRPALQWAGKVEQKAFPVPELPELSVTFLQAIPDEPCNDKGLFDRIKDAFG
jgi:hypothetical protein